MTALIAFETTITSAMHYTEGKGVIADELCRTGSLDFTLGLTNNLGRAEDISITAELGSQNSMEFSATVSKPRLRSSSIGSQFQVAQQHRYLQQYSSYTEDTRKAAATLYRYSDGFLLPSTGIFILECVITLHVHRLRVYVCLLYPCTAAAVACAVL